MTMNDNLFKLGEYDEYTPYALWTNYDEKTLKSEYSRLRSIARKRLERLKSSPEFSGAQFVKNWGTGFPTVKDIGNNKMAIAANLSRVSNFLNAQSSTVTGIKETYAKMLENYKEVGYDFIDKSNVVQFSNFLDYLRSQHILRYADSDSAYEFFSEYKGNKSNAQEMSAAFEKWVSRQK